MLRKLDLRRSPRKTVRLSGRGLLLPQRTEFACEAVDISGVGMLVIAPQIAPVGARVVIYLDGLGRLEGEVARTTAIGFAVSFTHTPRKQQQVEADLARLG
jgi:hypothetical protein